MKTLFRHVQVFWRTIFFICTENKCLLLLMHIILTKQTITCWELPKEYFKIHVRASQSLKLSFLKVSKCSQLILPLRMYETCKSSMSSRFQSENLLEASHDAPICFCRYIRSQRSLQAHKLCDGSCLKSFSHELNVSVTFAQTFFSGVFWILYETLANCPNWWTRCPSSKCDNFPKNYPIDFIFSSEDPSTN